MDKVIEKEEQYAELCKMLAVGGYGVELLPAVMGSVGTHFKCLDRATKEIDIPNARQKKLYSKPHLHSIQSAKPCVPTPTPGKTTVQPQTQGEELEADSFPSHPTLSIGADR
jgi:hypothetical protein